MTAATEAPQELWPYIVAGCVGCFLIVSILRCFLFAYRLKRRR